MVAERAEVVIEAVAERLELRFLAWEQDDFGGRKTVGGGIAGRPRLALRGSWTG
jgi:hypothetical protein